MYLLKCKELFNKTALDSESYFIKKKLVEFKISIQHAYETQKAAVS